MSARDPSDQSVSPSADAASAPDRDIWSALRQATAARIGLGRAGNAIPLGEVLDFQFAHATARDAVHTPLDIPALEDQLAPLPLLRVASAATDRSTYLRRPDLGRILSPDCDLPEASETCDIVFVIADGLSATAIQRHAAPVIHACRAALAEFAIGPVVIASQARVAIGDPIGAMLKAQVSVVLVGERPGLTVSDSLGLYLTFGPRPGRRDSERNCISNVHDHGGLTYEGAARTLSWLVREALRRQLSGVDLKDDLPAAVTGPGAQPQLPTS
ncbi:ethanolamine ammonia-lyase subunit EutC [Tardiphaga sp.]|jgi:ethanolamine ammonia-lyase small subunit|uniref:ethanolamine ammonia-lyase subunit EutC n=1 Tax=Tardiphaga sp. TaxID=1926292 RepID=UPI00352A89FF